MSPRFLSPSGPHYQTKASSRQVSELPRFISTSGWTHSFVGCKARPGSLGRGRLCAGGKPSASAPVPRHGLCAGGSHHTCSPEDPCAGVQESAREPTLPSAQKAPRPHLGPPSRVGPSPGFTNFPLNHPKHAGTAGAGGKGWSRTPSLLDQAPAPACNPFLAGCFCS